MANECPKYQTNNPEDSKFCKECGTSFTDFDQPIPTKTLETPTEELKRGSIFAGRYEIIEELGKGGMGKVYKEILRSVAIVYDWPDLKPSVVSPVQLPLETLNSYTGRYIFNNILPTEVNIESGHLKMEGDDGRIFLWYPDSDNHFIDIMTGWELEFIFDEENEVTGAFIGMGEAVRLRAKKIDN